MDEVLLGIKDLFVNNALLEYGDLISSVTIAFVFFVGFDFLHILFSAVLSWFKR